MSESLNDRAISALSALKIARESIKSDHPMRHAVRTTIESATSMLCDAMNHAERTAWAAKQIIDDYDNSK